ncbi:MAG TPA: YafY family protein [Gammaproteobacteria bacterium]|nr:YafY family protein [Gammaproteobacteria bacterium]
MRRADRLFQLVQYFRRRRRPVPARVVAEDFGVCTRTIYRDIQDLAASGVPIRGEPGIGYELDKSYYLPPVRFSVDEIEAISLGISMVRSWTDAAFAERADQALQRIRDVLPGDLIEQTQELALFSVPSASKPPWTVSFSGLRRCILDKRKVRLAYTDEHGQRTRRTVRPLSMVFFGPVWLLVAWCEKRQDFRAFRLDRIRRADELGERFVDEPDKSLARYIERVRAEAPQPGLRE